MREVEDSQARLVSAFFNELLANCKRVNQTLLFLALAFDHVENAVLPIEGRGQRG